MKNITCQVQFHLRCASQFCGSLLQFRRFSTLKSNNNILEQVTERPAINRHRTSAPFLCSLIKKKKEKKAPAYETKTLLSQPSVVFDRQDWCTATMKRLIRPIPDGSDLWPAIHWLKNIPRDRHKAVLWRRLRSLTEVRVREIPRACKAAFFTG